MMIIKVLLGIRPTWNTIEEENKKQVKPIIGLTNQEATMQTELGNVNVLPGHSGKSVKTIVTENICTYFNAIFALITVLLIIAGSYKSLTFLPVIIANTIIGIVQQLRAKKVLDELSLLAITEYTVVRDGDDRRLPMEQLVLGDVLILESGQQTPADAKVVEGKIAANEALLTGEADEIEKSEGSELKSDSFVVSGKCYARLTHIGKDSYAAKLTAKAKETKDKPSEMIRDINLIIKIAGILIIPIGAALFCQSMFVNGDSFTTSVVSMVGAVIGMIPEGLYLLVTIALALSAARLARVKVLLHDMRSTETLARVDVLCVDKTGTITDNEMKIAEIFAPIGVEEELHAAESILSDYVHTITDSNITMTAIRSFYPEHKTLSVVSIAPFSSRTKYSEIITEKATYRLGAPEFLLEQEKFKENRILIEQCAEKGERVLAFVKGEGDNFRPILFISLANGLRKNVEETLTYLREQEVEVKVISGDNPLTVSRIAESVGIPHAERYIDATELETEKDIEDAVSEYTVFGRVKPEQKRQIVTALKAKGQRVAMTGDGVNDILAMKKADCSIAMGEGCDAARQAAQVVLLDSDFSHMKEIISEGRRDINNITRSATLFLYKNMFSMFLAIFSIINVLTYPLHPSQVSLISMFNIGIPAFALALEVNEKKQKGRFLHQALIKSLPAALTSFLSIAAMVVFGQVFNISTEDVGIASTFLLSIVGFMVLKRISTPMNWYRFFVIIGCIVGLVICAYKFNNVFNIDYISTKCVMLCVVFAIAGESIMRNLTLLFEDRKSLLWRKEK